MDNSTLINCPAPHGDPSSQIRLMLDLSTSHLPEDLGVAGLGEADGVVAYPTPNGWIMWVPDDPADWSAQGDEPVPPVVLAVQRYARAGGCDFVLLDGDASRVDDLPVWEW